MQMAEKLTSDEAMRLWLPQFPFPTPQGNKYTRGHALVIGGPLQTSGAAKLAGTCALRTAAGLVTILAPDEEAMKVYVASSGVNALMYGTYKDLDKYLADARVTCVIVGPGFGKGEKQQKILDAINTSEKAVLMDADALDTPRPNSRAVLTPHEGEFKRLFPDITGTREEKALKAAKETRSVVVLKGNETVIAAPNGRVTVNKPASPWLATAGSGDTLSGFIGALLTAGMPPYEAAIAGVWMHSKVGELAAPAVIADDLIDHITPMVRELEKLYKAKV